MTNQLQANWQRFRLYKGKKARLNTFFREFLPEVVFRTTKIEHTHVTRKSISKAFR